MSDLGDLGKALALALYCPTCEAARGARCRTNGGYLAPFHAARRRAAEYRAALASLALMTVLLRHPEAAALVIAAHDHAPADE